MTTTHGGKRAGSGRKKRPETTTLSFRVLKDSAEAIKAAILELISGWKDTI